MIKLKGPFNYKGTLLEAGVVIQLDPEVEAVMIKNDTAEKFEAEPAIKNTDEETLDLSKLNKKSLLEHALTLGIEGLNHNMTNAEIIARIEEHGKV